MVQPFPFLRRRERDFRYLVKAVIAVSLDTVPRCRWSGWQSPLHGILPARLPLLQVRVNRQLPARSILPGLHAAGDTTVAAQQPQDGTPNIL